MAEAALAGLPLVRVLQAPDTATLDALLREENTPFIVRGLVRDWPLVQAGLESNRAARAFLLAHARERDFIVSMAEPDANGRLFYDAAMAVNFRMGKGRLPDIFAGFDAAEGRDVAQVPTVYLGSVDMQEFFDGLADAHPMPLGSRSPLTSLWIGNASRIAAHNDFPDNLACCAVGRRRFTLFPPDQFANLYLGPIDVTPAGRPISM
ncbi:MAG: cupin-like domain-containing protein, partial [Sphingobium sp.]|nr:cupin-like domain-containing protein [Sphingobium sp.]